MSILLIDSGNTFLKVGIVDHPGSEIKKVKRLSNVKEIGRIEKIDCAICSDVGGRFSEIHDLLKDKEINCIKCDHKLELAFKLDYKTPETLGSDRIAAISYAFKQFKNSNVLVIDIGTCITYDFLDKEGTYHGGAISPGIGMRLKAMNKFTAGLPEIDEKELEFFEQGKSTKESMMVGTLIGIQGEIQGFIDRYSNKYNDLIVVIGGGSKNYFDTKLKGNIFAAENLILEGLNSILSFHDSQ